jgi:hypothetical protein
MPLQPIDFPLPRSNFIILIHLPDNYFIAFTPELLDHCQEENCLF